MIPFILAAVGGALIGSAIVPDVKKFDSGGSVPNYEENSAEQVWNLWNTEQREHFIADHFGVKALDSDYQNKDWDDLPSNVQVNVEIHLLQGQYKEGGKIPDYKIFEGCDHFKGKSVYRVMGVENDYVGEWHKDIPDAQKELDELCSECKQGARIAEMVQHWNKYGWAGSSLNNDDSAFFEEIGRTYGNTPNTSFTGGDIKYYDDERVEVTTGGFRPIKFEGGGKFDNLDEIEKEYTYLKFSDFEPNELIGKKVMVSSSFQRSYIDTIISVSKTQFKTSRAGNFRLNNGMSIGHTYGSPSCRIIDESKKNSITEKTKLKLSEGGTIESLLLKFSNEEQFEKAKIHFETISDFYPYDINNEFRTFYFSVSDQDDADSTEFYLNQELQETDISGYQFEGENGNEFSKGGGLGEDDNSKVWQIKNANNRYYSRRLGTKNEVSWNESPNQISIKADGGNVKEAHYEVNGKTFKNYQEAYNYCYKYRIPHDEIVETKKYADGGSLDELYKKMKVQSLTVRARIASIIGMDKAIDYKNTEYIVSPFNLIEGAVRKEFITIDEIDEKLWDSAVSEADDIEEDYKDSGQGIGGSDMNAFISRMLNHAGIKIGVVDNRYQRMEKGGLLMLKDKVSSLLSKIEKSDTYRYIKSGAKKTAKTVAHKSKVIAHDTAVKVANKSAQIAKKLEEKSRK